MKQVILDKDMYVAGISIRTTNTNHRSQEDIGVLWQRFFADDIQSLIPQIQGDDMYCIYTDYENADQGYYTTILGFATTETAHLPAPLTRVKLPAGNYHCFTSEDQLPASVLKTWTHIWQTETSRSFTIDFDRYINDSNHADKGKVFTCLYCP